MKIYTKTGDLGETGLYGGRRVSKSDIRLEAYGTIDELNSYLGLIRSLEIHSHQQTLIIDIQTELFTIGAHLATDEKRIGLLKKIIFLLSKQFIKLYLLLTTVFF